MTTPGYTASAATWYHVVVVQNVGRDLRLYVNGSLIDTLAVGTPSAATMGFQVGGLAGGTHGRLAHRGSAYSYYNRALTAAEVYERYLIGLEGPRAAHADAPMRY